MNKPEEASPPKSIPSWPIDQAANAEVRAALKAAKIAALDDGKPQLEEMIERIDSDLMTQEQSAGARVSAGFGPPGQEWARRMVVLEAILKLLRWNYQNQDVIVAAAKAGK